MGSAYALPTGPVFRACLGPLWGGSLPKPPAEIENKRKKERYFRPILDLFCSFSAKILFKFKKKGTKLPRECAPHHFQPL